MTNGEKIKEIFPTFEFIEETEKYKTPQHQFLKVHGVNKMPYMEFDLGWWNAEYKKSTTKNDLAQERYQDLIEYFGDEKVIKTILEDKKEFKAWLERLRWNVKRADELARELEQIKGTTKNDLGVDAVSRNIVLTLINDVKNANGFSEYSQYEYLFDQVDTMPSVTPQKIVPIAEIKYDEEKLKELMDKAVLTVAPQEREVLDKIRTEIEKTAFVDANGSKYIFVNRVNQIIDKYRKESEG